MRAKRCLILAAVICAAGLLFWAGRDQPVDHVPASFAPKNGERPSWPPDFGGPDLIHPVTVTTPTAIRTRIVDSHDLAAAVVSIDASSATVEKLAAADILFACGAIQRAQRPKESGLAPTARLELQKRCGKLLDISRAELAQHAIELQQSARDDDSPLSHLIRLSQKSLATRSHWYEDDLKLVNDALISNDPVTVREASRAVFAQLYDGSPDSDSRAYAFLQASELYWLDRQTDFDRLVNCANSGYCDYVSRTPVAGTVDSSRAQQESQRLLEHYRRTFEQKTRVEDLLRLR